MKRPLYLILLTTLAMVSCTKEIVFSGEEAEPKMVINCAATVGVPLSATLSKSIFFLTQEEDIDTSVPEDLKVSLFVNDLPMGEMRHTKDSLIPRESYPPILIQYFTSDYRPAVGDVIRIEATASGFDKAVGTTSPLPGAVSVAVKGIALNSNSEYNLEYVSWQGFYDLWIKSYATLTLEITDPNPGQTDFFMLYGGYDFPMEHVNVPNAYARMRINTSDPVFANQTNDIASSILVYRPYTQYLFRDLLFDGSSYLMRIPIDFIIGLYDLADTALLNPTEVSLPIEHLSSELNQYLYTLTWVEDGAEFLTEPTQVHNNIQGGYGIVGGKHIDTLSFTLPLPDFSMINDTLI